MRRYEALHGVRVVTYCIMTNHSHLLMEIPPGPTAAGPKVTDASTASVESSKPTMVLLPS